MTRKSPTSEGTGRRAGLDRAAMVDRALALVKAEGPTALTMRRLATELDVTTTTIYWHVGSRDELIGEIIQEQSRRFAAREVTGSTPRERVMSAAGHIWESAIEHRAITSLAHQSGAMSLLEHPLQVTLARELEAAGVTGAAASQAMRGILAAMGGFLVLALRDETAIPEPWRSSALWADTDAELDRDTIAAMSEQPDLHKLFEVTVQAVVDSHLPSLEDR